MSGQSFNCPSCGAPLEVTNRFSKVLICQYCGQTALINAQNLDPTGKAAALADFPSILSVGATGTLRGKEFRCLGRLRYKYDEGFWDEWFINVGASQNVWLQEDEGIFVSFEKKTITAALPKFGGIEVGSSIRVNDMDVFVLEKNEAVIAGGEGELYFRVQPGERIDYLDGTAHGKLVSVEFSPQEINLSVGDEIPITEIKVSN